MELQGKAALITGGSSGIGKAIARRFAAAGARVAIAGRNLEAAQETALEIASQTGGNRNTIAIRMDVADEHEVNAGVEAVARAFGTVDILVSNAGVQIVHPVEEFPFADWRKIMAIHLDGAFLTTRACLKYMYPQNGGALIYMGSVHSHEASPLKSAYVAAKHGLLGLARVVAKEGAKHNVRANVVCPGFVKTPLVEKQIPKLAADLGIPASRVVAEVLLRETVDGQFTSAEDVAEVTLALAAFPSNAMTGQSVVVSHGWRMN